MSPISPLVDENLASLSFWAKPPEERDALFASLRTANTRIFCPLPNDEGFFALTRYEEVAEASRHPDVFSSQPTATSPVDPSPTISEFSGSMISMDDPRHARLRRIVSRSFTPRMIQRFADDVAALATQIVDDLKERGPCDFVTQVAMPMPLQIICSMMGIPRTAHDEVIDATNAILALGDPEHVDEQGRGREEVIVDKFTILHELVVDLARQRKEQPGEDLITALIHANVDGEALTDHELRLFFTLLVVAGNETTRNAISHALALLTAHPEQRSHLLGNVEDRLPAAVEEVVRYSTPVTWMRRTLTRDYELMGSTYHAGDRVILYYVSANRDEREFKDPHAFDITRSPNAHFGFGAPGPHFCLGAHLARREVTVMLREIYTRLPEIHSTAEPIRQRASFINGIKSLPCAF